MRDDRSVYRGRVARTGSRDPRRRWYAAVFDILANRRGFEPINIEDHAIIIDRLRADRTKGSVDRFGTVLAVAEQVEIARRPKWRLHQSHKQHRALEDKSVAMLRPAQTIQESFQGITSQQDLEIGALVAETAEITSSIAPPAFTDRECAFVTPINDSARVPETGTLGHPSASSHFAPSARLKAIRYSNNTRKNKLLRVDTKPRRLWTAARGSLSRHEHQIAGHSESSTSGSRNHLTFGQVFGDGLGVIAEWSLQ